MDLEKIVTELVAQVDCLEDKVAELESANEQLVLLVQSYNTGLSDDEFDGLFPDEWADEAPERF